MLQVIKQVKLFPIWIMDLCKFDDNDKKIYNKSPKWTGGINNSFTYKNWNLSFFTYFRFGNTYYGLTQTIGRRIEKDTWSPTNTDAKFAQPTTATRETKYDYVRNYTKGKYGSYKEYSFVLYSSSKLVEEVYIYSGIESSFFAAVQGILLDKLIILLLAVLFWNR